MARTARHAKLAGITDDVVALAVLRDRLAAEIDGCTSGWLLAQLAPQFTACVKLQREIAPAATSRIDEIAERRARRRAAAVDLP